MIKEKLCTCYISLDNNTEKASEIERKYETPDESVVTIDIERFGAPEIVFTPAKVPKYDTNKVHGMHKDLFQSIMTCDKDIRDELYQNIVLSGGNTMFDGLKERIEKEIKNLAADDQVVKVIASPDRQYNTWIGACSMIKQRPFDLKWITREDYNEFGSQIVHKKCGL